MRTSRAFVPSLVAMLVAVSAARAEQLNVSQIATGTFTPIDFAAAALQPLANDGATLTYFALGTGSIDSEPTGYFSMPPWSSAFHNFLFFPFLRRLDPTADYMDGNATFEYDISYFRRALVDMSSSTTKQVESALSKSAAVSAAVSYAARIEHTGADPLDYFMVLKVPAYDRKVNPAYDLCCSGDPNGGTYSYHRPKAAKARGAVDVYVDGLPVWSNESAYMYPALASSDPFDSFERSWGKDPGPAQSTLYLGRLSAGDTLTVDMISRTDVSSDAPDCGIEGPFSPFGDPVYSVHCFNMRQQIVLQPGSANDPAPVGFRIYSKHPPAAAIIGGGGLQ